MSFESPVPRGRITILEEEKRRMMKEGLTEEEILKKQEIANENLKIEREKRSAA